MEKNRCYVGIDIGKFGGIAVITDEGVQTFQMPKTKTELPTSDVRFAII